MVATETEFALESLTFSPDSRTYQARYDRSETDASMAVVSTVAEVLSVDPTEMEQLYYTVDTSSLDELLRGRHVDDDTVSVTFTFAGCEVTVTESEVTVAADEPDADPGDGRQGDSDEYPAFDLR